MKKAGKEPEAAIPEQLVPRWTVRARIDIDPSALAWLGKDGFRRLATSYNPSNQRYESLGRVSWETARALLEKEGALIRDAVAQAGSSVEYGRIVEELAEQRGFWDDAGRLSGLDLGIVGPVAVLASSGCVTFDSCAGHVECPRVDFYVPEARRTEYLALLTKAARTSRAGLINDTEGRLEVFAATVVRLWRFAASFLELAVSAGLRHVPEPKRAKGTGPQLILPGFGPAMSQGREEGRGDWDSEEE